MQRGALLIGVSQTGGLPKLQAVQSGLDRMKAWAASQGIAGKRLELLDDSAGKVRAHQVADAIERLLKDRDLDQLVVYFSGHGIHNNGDRWLLSDAPVRSEEAVNVEGSMQLARDCGVSHVVLMSDACRTAAEGIQALGVSGINIFPNDPVDGSEHPVDAFFACARGKPALEVRDPLEAAAGYSALYTEVLAECLGGQHADALERVVENGATFGLVRAWRLNDALSAMVPPRLKQKLGRIPTVNQMPVARIGSREAWLSRLDAAQLPPATRSAAAPPAAAAPALSPQQSADELLSAAMRPSARAAPPPQAPLPAPGPGPGPGWGHTTRSGTTFHRVNGPAPVLPPGIRIGIGAAPARSTSSLLQNAADAMTVRFGPGHMETNCGFKLRGARVAAVHSPHAGHDIFDDPAGSLVRIHPKAAGAVSVLLELDDGCGVLLPAIPDFIAELHFDGGEWIHLAWEPSDTTSRWLDYQSRAAELRTLRAAVAASAGLGVFRLAGENALGLAQRMQVSKSFDPSMAIYAAYAYHDLGQRDRIRQMQDYLRADLGFMLFDIAMLAADDTLRRAAKNDDLLPPVPLLAQGWSLLEAFKAPIAPKLMALQRHLMPSLWTLFAPAGTKAIVKAFANKEIRR